MALCRTSPDRRIFTRAPSAWWSGDIAFLKPHNEFTPSDRQNLIESGAVHRAATGHPVVILKNLSDNRVVVTTVSAFSAGDLDGYKPPWKKAIHARKDPDDFRSFQGSERANPKYSRLQLEGDKAMPKPRASWIYIQSVFEVPISTLKFFTKARTILRLTDSSLCDLRGHIAARCKRYCPSWDFGPSTSSTSTGQERNAAAPPGKPDTTHMHPWSRANQRRSRRSAGATWSPEEAPPCHRLSRDVVVARLGRRDGGRGLSAKGEAQ